jgi:hypothetical protein
MIRECECGLEIKTAVLLAPLANTNMLPSRAVLHCWQRDSTPLMHSCTFQTEEASAEEELAPSSIGNCWHCIKQFHTD